MPDLLEYADNTYSQNGEDGILREIFDRLDIESGWFCEFGAWDGKHLSNCYALLDDGWDGVMIEGDAERYSDLQETQEQYADQLEAIHSLVTPSGENSLGNTLDQTDAPKRFDLLSIDVDGEDYHIWKGLEKYEPGIVVIEFNPQFGTDIRFISDLTPGGYMRVGTNDRLNGLPNDAIRATGSSFRALVELGEEKGYAPVAATEINLVFARDDLVSKLGLPDRELSDPENLFLDEWSDVDWWNPPTPIYRRNPRKNLARLRDIYRDRGTRGIYKACVRTIKRDL